MQKHPGKYGTFTLFILLISRCLHFFDSFVLQSISMSSFYSGVALVMISYWLEWGLNLNCTLPLIMSSPSGFQSPLPWDPNRGPAVLPFLPIHVIKAWIMDGSALLIHVNFIYIQTFYSLWLSACITVCHFTVSLIARESFFQNVLLCVRWCVTRKIIKFKVGSICQVILVFRTIVKKCS